MRLNHPDYIKLVIEAYKKKRANNELSFSLAHSTPAKIKKECLNVYKERYDKKDEQLLKSFFGPAEQGRNFLQLIHGFDADRFKPLDNYLKGITEKTDDKNVELLAWLIDFQHRPYVFEKNVFLGEEELSLIGLPNDPSEKKETESLPEEEDLQSKPELPGSVLKKEPGPEPVENKTKEPIPLNGISKDKKRYKKAAIIFLIMVICIGSIYTIWQQHIKANTVCAFWAYDHYEEISCSAEPKGRVILAMNKEKVKSFRMITRPDTITERSIGKIYYIKDSTIFKYYTESGKYPEDINRNVKLLSARIFYTKNKKEFPFKDTLTGQ